MSFSASMLVSGLTATTLDPPLDPRRRRTTTAHGSTIALDSTTGSSSFSYCPTCTPGKKNMRLKFSSQSASSSIYADENDVSHVADL